ncbi:helix-turn-helix domain-containing protein [Mycobacterium fragae]|nr:helix-turn-helix domain-containing protein [Mycobacterium fragae]
MRVWDLGPGRLMVSGAFRDLAPHHHAAVQIGVGTGGPLVVSGAEGGQRTCRLVVIRSGTRHAVRSDARSTALTIYLGLQTRQGVVLNSLSRDRSRRSGVWIVESGEELADATGALLTTKGPRAAADFLVGELCSLSDAGSGSGASIHPQLRQAIDLISSNVPATIDLVSVAGAVALSPDYLGRLCRRQTGASFSATARWVRLLTAFRYLSKGVPITDAAHLAGFADGSHANRVCWEMTGAAPSDFARALAASRLPTPLAG